MDPEIRQRKDVYLFKLGEDVIRRRVVVQKEAFMKDFLTMEYDDVGSCLVFFPPKDVYGKVLQRSETKCMFICEKNKHFKSLFCHFDRGNVIHISEIPFQQPTLWD